MKNQKVILASSSTRRKEILTKCGFDVQITSPQFDEKLPQNTPFESVPLYLATEKMKTVHFLKTTTPIITADTIVLLNNTILSKPNSKQEAKASLEKLSNQTHKVITACCIKKNDKLISITDSALVDFDTLTTEQINYYIETFKPYDKAGAYGIQEYIGMVGIKKITGSFYTIMGLPIHKIYNYLLS